MLKDFLPQTSNQWKLLGSHIVGSLVLYNLALLLPTALALVVLITMVFIYGELMELKGKISGSIFEWTKIKAMLSSLDDKHVLWQWAAPMLALLLWTRFF